MYYPENYFALQYQAAVDCKRIQAVHAIADLAERYKVKQGYYPLMDVVQDSYGEQAETAAVSVIITDKQLPKSYIVNPPKEIEGRLLQPSRFEKEVGEVLGIAVKLPYDPQTNFAWEKRFYLYKVNSDGQYSVSGTLFSETEYTQKQGAHRYQYQVGSAHIAGDNTRIYNSIKDKFISCDSP
jgi:hypothetical protein